MFVGGQSGPGAALSGYASEVDLFAALDSAASRFCPGISWKSLRFASGPKLV
jgi:hypothetical protein